MRDLATLANLASAAFQSGRTPCTCCKGMASSVGAVDFNKSCEELRGTFLAPASVPVTYFLCPDCGFLFTRFFDAWSREEFAAHINSEIAKLSKVLRDLNVTAN